MGLQDEIPAENAGVGDGVRVPCMLRPCTFPSQLSQHRPYPGLWVMVPGRG